MKEFEEGYNEAAQKLKSFDFISEQLSSSLGTQLSSAWTSSVQREIDKTTNDLNSLSENNLSADKLQGFAAEKWHAGTYDINSAVKGSSKRASQLGENGLGSVDIEIDDGTTASGKYYRNATLSTRAQATTYGERFHQENSARIKRGEKPLTWKEYCENKRLPTETKQTDLLYGQQQRIIPSDQVEDAIKYLDKKIAKEYVSGRVDEAKRYEAIKKLLTDRITDEGGNSSIALSRSDAEAIIHLVKEGKLDPKLLSIDLKSVIKPSDIIREAFEAGKSAALMSFIISVAPVIIEAIEKYLSDGHIGAEEFRKMGFSVMKGTANGFVSGTLSACIKTCCRLGYFGDALVNADPSFVGSIVALTLHIVEESVKLSSNIISKQEFVKEIMQATDIAAFSTSFGIIAAAIFPQATVVSYMIGSFVGTAVGELIFKFKEKVIISFCIESGCTFFGMVEQDYRLPNEVLSVLGIKIFEYSVFQPNRFEFNRFMPQSFDFNKSNYSQFDIKPMRRGLISVSKIGYKY